jgi:hypothetical protein
MKLSPASFFILGKMWKKNFPTLAFCLANTGDSGVFCLPQALSGHPSEP